MTKTAKPCPQCLESMRRADWAAWDERRGIAAYLRAVDAIPLGSREALAAAVESGAYRGPHGRS